MVQKLPLRILIADDNEAIHEDFLFILGESEISQSKPSASLEANLFGQSETSSAVPLHPLLAGGNSFNQSIYEISSAFQGGQAVDLVEQALNEGNPFALVFMDVRMPPGMDGIQAIQKIWMIAPQTHVVICTAYSDYSWEQIIDQLGENPNLLFVRKPFDSVAIKQIALSMTQKWQLGVEQSYYNQQLNDEVKSRTLELERLVVHLKNMKIKAEKATTSKSMFLSKMSHELRTPLSGIVGIADLLMDSNLDKEQVEYLEIIRRSGESLKSIVNDILDFSKAEEGKILLAHEPMNPCLIFEQVAEMTAVLALPNEVEVSTFVSPDIPLLVMGDAERLRQVMLNFASNAAKFTVQGSIQLRLELASMHPRFSAQDASASYGSNELRAFDENMLDKDKVWLNFEIKDSGVGIPEDVQRLLFQPFMQIDSALLSQFSGSGLGLSICKQLVDLMQGRIFYSSQENQGSTFSFQIGFHAISRNESMNGHQYKTLLPKAHYLHCGDNEIGFADLARYVHAWGYQIMQVNNFEVIQNSLDQLDDDLPIIILVNYLDGILERYLDAVEHFAFLSPQGRKVQFIALLPVGELGRNKLLKAYGYSAWLTRPLKRNHLFNALLLLNSDASEAAAEPVYFEKRFLGQLTKPACEYHILVADDNKVSRQLLGKMLQKWGMHANLVENGIAAVDAAATMQFDLIFMDCNMEVMDGYLAAQTIRSHQLNASTPIVAITADVLNDNRQRCLDAGMNSFVTKPFQLTDILDTLEQFFAV